jgi:hypothetical protein
MNFFFTFFSNSCRLYHLQNTISSSDEILITNFLSVYFVLSRLIIILSTVSVLFVFDHHITTREAVSTVATFTRTITPFIVTPSRNGNNESRNESTDFNGITKKTRRPMSRYLFIFCIFMFLAASKDDTSQHRNTPIGRSQHRFNVSRATHIGVSCCTTRDGVARMLSRTALEHLINGLRNNRVGTQSGGL